MTSQETPVHVFLRLRSASKQEEEGTACIQVLDRRRIVIDGGAEYEWDGILDEGASDDQVHRDACSNIPQQMMEGFNCTVAAYGSTNSGKSHTISGLFEPLFESIFTSLREREDLHECTVRCSVVEIYLERMRDLLNEPSRVQLGSTGQLEGCASVSCWNPSDAIQLIQQGLVSRTVSATTPNNHANRSTAVVQLLLYQKLKTGQSIQSRLQLMDLVACELVQPTNKTLEATQVSISLKALQQQVRALANSKPPIPSSDLPAVARLLSAQLAGPGSAHTTFLCTASRYRPFSSHFLKFATDCRNCSTQPVMLTVHNDKSMNETAEWQHSCTRWRRWAELLALECGRLRDRQSWDRQLWPLVEHISQTAQSDGDKAVPSAENTVERMRQYTQYKKAVEERAQAFSERDQLCSDLAIVQAQSVSLADANKQLVKQVEFLQRENRKLHFRKHQAEETLRISQFREAEAIVFLRQLRRFYFRLVQKAMSEGTKGQGALDLKHLVDMDHFMVQSGLLEESEVGGDAAIEARPTKECLERSIAQADREVRKKAEEAKASEVSNVENGAAATPLDPQRPVPASVVEKESPAVIEARQKLYQTPSGRFISMREKILEDEVQKIAEMNMTLKSQLEEEKTNVRVLCNKAGLAAPIDKMRIAQEIRSLKEQLSRKNNDLKAVIWKMNELHTVGKNLTKTLQSREQRLASTEKNVLDLQSRCAASIERSDKIETEAGTVVRDLQVQLKRLVVPVWQLSRDQRATPAPLSGRLVVPIPNNSALTSTSTASVGDPGEWADIDYYPRNENVVATSTQTELVSRSDTSAQTDDSILVVDRSNTKSISVQTDDIHILAESPQITEDNVTNFLFMDTPEAAGRGIVEGAGLNPAPYAEQDKQTTSDPTGPDPQAIEDILNASNDDGNGDNFLNSFLFDRDEPSSAALTPLIDYMANAPMEVAAGSNGSHSPADYYYGIAEVGMKSSFEQTQAPLADFGERANAQLDPTPFDSSKASPRHDIVGVVPASPPNEELQKTTRSFKSPPNIHNIKPRPFSRDDRERGSPSKSPYRTTTKSYTFAGASSLETPFASVRGTTSSVSGTSQDAMHTSRTSRSDVNDQLSETEDNRQTQRSRPTKGKEIGSFLDRLKSQAKKKKLDDDEQSETPEFMRLFRKIGSKNKNEKVLESSGAAPLREASRTSIETLKVRKSDSTDTVNQTSYRKWQPKTKKKESDDSDSSSDDSFAKSFMRGAQMSKPADSSGSSSDDSFAKSFMKGAQISGNPEKIPEGDEDESAVDDSSIKSDTGTGVPDAEKHASQASPPVSNTTSVITRESHSGSDSDSSSNSSVARQSATPKAPPAAIVKGEAIPSNASPPVTLEVPAKSTSGKTDTDSSSSSSSTSKVVASPKKTPIIANPSSLEEKGGLYRSPAKHTRRDPVQSDSEDSDSSAQKTPVAQPALQSGGAVNKAKSEASANPSRRSPTRKSFLDSSSSSSSDSDESRLKRRHVPVPAKPKPDPDSSDSSSQDNTQEARTPPVSSNSANETAAAAAVQKITPEAKKTRNESESSSSDDSSEDEPRVATTPSKQLNETKPKITSTDSSSESSSSASRQPRNVPPPKVKPVPRKDDSSSDSESDSDDTSEADVRGRNPTPTPIVKPRAEEDDSDSDLSDEESGQSSKEAKPTEKPLGTTTQPTKRGDSDSDSSSDSSSASESVPTRAPKQTTSSVVNRKVADDSSSSGSSSDSSSTKKPSKLPPARDSKQPNSASVTNRRLSNGTSSSSSASSSDSSSTKKRSKLPTSSALTNQIKPPPPTQKKNNADKKKASNVSDKSKFVIKDGKLVRREGNETAKPAGRSTKPGTPGSRKGKPTTGAKGAGPRGKSGSSARNEKRRPPKTTGKKAAFTIVGGKLVKNTDSG